MNIPDIVEEVLSAASKKLIFWFGKEIVNLNPGGIAIPYDLYWGELSDSKIVCFARYHGRQHKEEHIGQDSFLLVGTNCEVMKNAIRHPTIARPGHLSDSTGIEIAENEDLYSKERKDRYAVDEHNERLDEKFEEIFRLIEEK